MDNGWNTSLEVKVCVLTTYILSYMSLIHITFCAGESSQNWLHFLVLHDGTVVLLHGESINRMCAFHFVQRECDGSIIMVCEMNVLSACWVLFVHHDACAMRIAP